jgi:hypothetical protein
VADLLSCVHALDLRLALVTNGPSELQRDRLRSLGLSDAFVDPTPGLNEQYKQASARLEARYEGKKGLRNKWRLSREKKRLQEESFITRTTAARW